MLDSKTNYTTGLNNKPIHQKNLRGLGMVFLLAFLILSLTGCKSNSLDPSNNQEVLAAENDNIYENIHINDIDVSGLSKEEATKKLEDGLNKTIKDKKITITYGDKSEIITYEELETSYEIEAAVNLAYDYGRKGSKEENNEKINGLKNTPLELSANFNYNKTVLNEKLNKIGTDITVEAKNAEVKRENGKFVITQDEKGVSFNKEETLEKVINHIESGKDGEVSAVVAESEAEYTAEDCEKATTLIGTYNTKIAGGTAGRNKNLDTASSKINNFVLYPGEVFSTNKAFGEMTTANGYSMAPVIVGGVLENGMGGGVCQVSSTLYMALLYAEVEIVERQNHSQRVGYLPAAYDATLAGDYIDLKFKNNTEYPLTIEAYITAENTLIVNIYGYEKHDSTRKLEFYTNNLGSYPPPAEEIIETENLPLGEREVKTTAVTGTKYDMFKIVYENGKEIDRVHVNESYYKPRRAVVYVGTAGSGESTEEIPEEGASDVNPPSDQPTPSPVPSDTPLAEPQGPAETPQAPVSEEPKPTIEEPIIDTPENNEEPIISE